jgi:UDP-glucose 4-epimerase
VLVKEFVSVEKHILITGGAGFIGSHLVERLLGERRRVVVIDDLSTGAIENLTTVHGHPGLRFVQARVSDCPELAEVISGAEAIYHLAAAVGVELVLKEPVRTIRTNLQETDALLNAASEAKVPVLLASTSEVYGKSGKERFSEEDDLLIGSPTQLRWSYACSKLMDEFLALAYTRERGLPIIIARLFNTVGPRQTGRYGMVLPRFVAAAKAGEPLRVFGDGRQTRCFCHVADAVEAMVRLQRCREAFGQIINVGGTEEISIGELAKLVVKLLDSRSTIQLVPYSDAYIAGFEDMPRRRPSIDRLEKLTGFRPQKSLEEAIQSLSR